MLVQWTTIRIRINNFTTKIKFKENQNYTSILPKNHISNNKYKNKHKDFRQAGHANLSWTCMYKKCIIISFFKQGDFFNVYNFLK
jgi:hypothetical protein